MTAPATEQPPAAEQPAMAEVSRCRDDVIVAALHLAATDWGNGLETAARSFALDDANASLDAALTAYTQAVISTYTATPQESS